MMQFLVTISAINPRIISCRYVSECPLFVADSLAHDELTIEWLAIHVREVSVDLEPCGIQSLKSTVNYTNLTNYIFACTSMS